MEDFENLSDVELASDNSENENKIEENLADSQEFDGTKEKPIGVYVRYDENGNIIEVNSDIFIKNFDGWTKIDEGYGDRYAHAQSQYFDEPLFTKQKTTD